MSDAAERSFDDLDQLVSLLELSPVPMLVFSVSSRRILAVNDAAVELYRRPHDEFVGLSMFDIRPPGEHERYQQMFADRLEPIQASLAPVSMIGLWQHLRGDGEVMWVEVMTSGVLVAGEPHRIVFVRDETERARAEAQRDRSIHRMIELQERLHNDIADRLHDGPVQTLTAASLRLGMLRRSADVDLSARLGEAEALVIDALRELRREMDDQRAPSEIADDFAGSIRSLVARFGLNDHYVVRSVGPDPSPAIGSLLYRVAQAVLSVSTLEREVDDPWIIDLEVTATESSLRLPVGADTDLEEQLSDWAKVMAGRVQKVSQVGHDQLTVIVRDRSDVAH